MKNPYEDRIAFMVCTKQTKEMAFALFEAGKRFYSF